MNNQNKNNKTTNTANTYITIGLIGLILMFIVIFSHGHINAQFSYVSPDTLILGSEELIEPELKPLPEKVLEEIIYDDVNIMGLEEYNKSQEILSPAFKFLRELTSPKFLTQK